MNDSINIFDEWMLKLNRVTEEDWGEVLKKQDSRRRNYYSTLNLWNVKYYYGNAEDYNGEGTYKIVNQNNYENPSKRKLFYLSKGRFAPPKVPVSYWSFTYPTAKVEATKELKENSYTLKEGIESYRVNQVLHPIVKWLKLDFPILDLAYIRRTTPFIDLITKCNVNDKRSFVDTIILGTDSHVYPLTQAIAQKAFENGFKGIIWESARHPNDGILCGNISLVLFSEDGLIDHKDELVVEEY
jgi:hypothetical protein